MSGDVEPELAKEASPYCCDALVQRVLFGVCHCLEHAVYHGMALASRYGLVYIFQFALIILYLIGHDALGVVQEKDVQRFVQRL